MRLLNHSIAASLMTSCLAGIIFMGIFSATTAQAGRKLTLRLLVWEGYAPSDHLRAFIQQTNARYDVELNFAIRPASDPNEFFNALRMGTVDIISPAHNLVKDTAYNLMASELTLPIDLAHAPNYAFIDPVIQYQPWAIQDGHVYAVPIVQGPYGLAYNADIVKPAPTSWNIFWDPQYAGAYLVQRDYYELNVYITALALGYSGEDIFHYDRIKGPLLEQKLTALAQGAGSLWAGFDQAAHFRTRSIATSWRTHFPDLNAMGENWRIAVPREGTTWWIDTLMLSHTLADRPLLKQIAEQWINYLLQPPVQVDALSFRLGVYPVTLPALKLYRQKRKQFPGSDEALSLLQNHIPWQALSARDRNAFNLLWTEARQMRREHQIDDATKK